MIPTACSAVVAQYRRGTLDIVWVRRLAPAAAIGAVVGSQLAAAANGRWVAMVFAIYVACIALKMLRGSPVAPTGAGRAARIVGALPVPLVGVLIGTFASIAGVGGASLTVPFLLSARVEMKRALAVSSAVGLAIALAGGAGFASVSAGSFVDRLVSVDRIRSLAGGVDDCGERDVVRAAWCVRSAHAAGHSPEESICCSVGRRVRDHAFESGQHHRTGRLRHSIHCNGCESQLAAGGFVGSVPSWVPCSGALDG